MNLPNMKGSKVVKTETVRSWHKHEVFIPFIQFKNKLNQCSHF